MIKPSRNVVSVGATGAIALGYGVAIADRDSWTRPAGIILGLAAIGCAAIAWKAADDEDRDSTRHPELMNGHFLTGGQASATSGDPIEIAELRELLGVDDQAVKRQRRRNRGNRLQR